MNAQPIGPRAHGAIDYGFFALQALAPRLFSLRGPAKTLAYAFAGSQGLLNALTDHPLALKRWVPFRVHGQIETPLLPALLVLPWATGAFRQRNARRFFGAFFTLALANYLLTDYRANEPKARAAQQ